MKDKLNKEIEENKVPTNHIEEYFTEKEGNQNVLIGKEIFKGDKDIELKTELNNKEIVLINNMMWNDGFLQKNKLSPLYSRFINNYMRLKLSLERKSRGEFVTINKGDKTDDILKGMSDLSNIRSAKK